MNTINLRGLECPGPVIETKNILEENPDILSLDIIVDNKAAVENVTRFMKSQSFSVKITEDADGFRLAGKRIESGEQNSAPVDIKTDKNFRESNNTTLIMFANKTIGSVEPELGSKLMLNYINTLTEIKESLWRLVFVNEGVKLTCENADTLPALQELEKNGVSIIVCGACLEFFNLLDQKKAGKTTNMLDIVTSLQVAEKIINF